MRQLGTRRYSILVDNTDFPAGYDSVRGTLAGVKKLRGFQDTEHRELVEAVLDDLTAFQMAVFTPSWDSYKVSDAVNAAAKVLSEATRSSDEIARVAGPFLDSFTGIFERPPDTRAEARPTTEAELTEFLQEWFKAWQRHVQKASYGGLSTSPRPGGLNSAISQLKAARHA